MVKANHHPIGIFDSGVGGITILQAIRQLLPDEELIFVADQAHVPYGLRPLEQVQAFAEGIVNFLLSLHAKAIIVACNTASAAALHYIRDIFPSVPIIGMEPAVKPAAKNTNSGVIGVLATQATFQGALYASLVMKFSKGVTLIQDSCIGLVNQIEAGAVDTAETRRLLEKILNPMLKAKMDTVVLGCTHYPFVSHLIREIVGETVEIIDPTFAVARQTERVLSEQGLLVGSLSDSYPLRFFTSASPKMLHHTIQRLPVNDEIKRVTIKGLFWQETGAMAWELQPYN